MRNVLLALTASGALSGTALAADENLAAMTEAARSIVAQMQGTLAPQLQKEIAASGPAGAIGVCKRVGTEAAAALSQKHGVRVTRVSLKPRNPVLGPATAWEQRALIDFDRRAAAGEKPETLERGEVVEEPQGRFFRYAKALPVQPLCLNCHGTSDKLAPGVKEQLSAEYPHDQATGYVLGQVRGAVSIKRRF